MSGLWVFILDPKNFLALIGLWTVIRWAIKIALWTHKVFRREEPRKPFAVNLNKDV